LLFAWDVTTRPLVFLPSGCCCPKIHTQTAKLETKIVLTCFLATMATIDPKSLLTHAQSSSVVLRSLRLFISPSYNVRWW
jgi:hypothetical protein